MNINIVKLLIIKLTIINNFQQKIIKKTFAIYDPFSWIFIRKSPKCISEAKMAYFGQK